MSPMMIDPELLSIALDAPPTEAGAFVGHAAIWDQVDAWGKRFLKGAFAAILDRMKAAGRYPGILWEHNKELLIGSQVLSEDDQGLRVDGQLWIADGPWGLGIDDARRAYNLIRTSVYGMSFRAPYSPADTHVDDEGHLVVARFADIYETTITSSPALNIARVEAVASAAGLRDIDRKLNALLASLGG